MTRDERLVPASSQTVGPFFQIGLEYLIEQTAATDEDTARINIHGRVLDRDGMPVPDALLEFWTPSTVPGAASAGSNQNGYPIGFKRAATDVDGNFTVAVRKPTEVQLTAGRMQSPHMLVLVFARGLLRHLISRVYFEGEPSNAADPVLQQIPAERRATLIAQLESAPQRLYRWNIVLQGKDETVFFAW